MITSTQRHIIAELRASAPLLTDELTHLVLDQQAGVHTYEQAHDLTTEALNALYTADLVTKYDSTDAHDLTPRGYTYDV